MQIYFFNEIRNEQVIFDKDQTHHIVNVMRMRVNDQITVVYNEEAFLATITSTNPLRVEVVENLHEDHELKNKVTLLYCIPKGEKLDLVIQKATELGVSEIILVQSERCIAKITKENKDKKLVRFNKIALEACEQSKRTKLPVIDKVIDYKDICKFNFDHSYIAYEDEGEISFKEKVEKIKENETIGIIIGSEGGFSRKEVDYAIQHGYTSVSLGKRILRSETAVFYALTSFSLLLER